MTNTTIDGPHFEMIGDLPPTTPPVFTVRKGNKTILDHATVAEIRRLLNGLNCPECGESMAHAWHDRPSGKSVIGCTFPVFKNECETIRIHSRDNPVVVHPGQKSIMEHSEALRDYSESVDEMIDNHE